MTERLHGSGEMAARIRDFDWARTALGPIAAWPERLLIVVETMLQSPLVSSIVCGPERILIYNDAGAALYGQKHPAALGQPLPATFPEGWATVAPLYERAFAGEAVHAPAVPLDTRGEGAAGDVFDAYLTPIRTAAGDVCCVHMQGFEIGGRLEAERRLRDSEERQGFLLGLSDAIRPLIDVGQIRATACRLLGEHVGASRACYVEYFPERACGIVADDYMAAGLPPLAGSYPFEAFRSTYERIANGTTWIVPDVQKDPELPDNEREFYASQGVIAWVDVPLAKAGKLEAALCVVHTSARAWTAQEVDLIAETAERLWSALLRGRAETALRESESRFRQFAGASSGALWIRDAATLSMEYISPAVARIYGVGPDALIGDVKKWAATILPEDRELALQRLEMAGHGESVVHEFRIQRPSDRVFCWIRNTDFPLLDEQGRVQRIGGIAEDVTEAKLSVEHQGVLLAELQHRVRNIMAIIRSITVRTGERAESVAEYRDILSGRLLALARVQALLTRAANVSIDLRKIVHDEVSVQAQHEGQYVLDGPDVLLPPKTAEVLTLAVHELATNALKYGALSVPGGKVTVRWSTSERRDATWLAFDWSEEGAPALAPPAAPAERRRGFGTELIEGRIPYELNGHGAVTITPGGARCHIELPLTPGASVLETGAPQRATVFGGALDMTGEPDLSGIRVLVVEDDYFLATDAARALRGAGADVLGPFSTEDAADAGIEHSRPDAAAVDINLGTGPSYRLAGVLKARSIPFVFMTGYDQEAIPDEFSRIERLEKPLQLRQIVGSVAKLLGKAA